MANIQKIKKFYSSNHLKLTMSYTLTLNHGFKFITSKKEIWVPDCQPEKVMIKLGLNHINLEELKTYIISCTKSTDKNISNEAYNLLNKYPRLFK
jgi:hypothetical protein